MAQRTSKTAKTRAAKKTAAKKIVTKKTAAQKAPAKADEKPAQKPAVKKPAVKKATLKNAETNASVSAFIDAVADDTRRADCRALVEIMSKATRSEPRMWGPSIVGFGTTTLTYASGRTLDWFYVGFSPRKGDLSIYLNSAFPERAALLGRFGKHKTGVSCIYVKRLTDIDMIVLREMVRASVAHSRTHGGGC